MPRRSGWLRAGKRSTGALVGVLALLLTACPSSTTTSPKPSGSVSPARPAGKQGGEIVVAYPHEPATLNPFLRGGDGPATRDITRALLPAFYRLGPNGERQRWLLAREPQEAEVSGGSFVVQIELRGDAVWSDGVPITTDDVRFTWETMLDRANPVATRDGYDKITDVRLIDAKKATLVFERPFARWKDLFSAGLGVLPKHALSAKPFATALAASWPVSGGPFIFKSWTRGLEIVLERNPKAWGDAPYLDSLRVQFVPDFTTALSLLQAGRVHVVGAYDGIDVARRGARIAGANVTSDVGGTWAGLWLNVRAPVLQDVRVRRALAHSIDRAAIAEGLVRDEGGKLDGLASPTDAPPSQALAQYKPDLTRARTLLADAGWTGDAGVRTRGGRELSFTVAIAAGDELSDRVLRALHGQAERSGFDLNAVTFEADKLWRDWLRGSRFEAAFVVVRDWPGGNLRDRFGTASPGNIVKLTDAAADQLLETADATWPRNASLFDAVERRLAALAPIIPLYRVRVSLIAGPAARGVLATASADGLFWNAADWSRT